jgi:hypothetical protein
MPNFLLETDSLLATLGKDDEDVLFVQTNGGSFSYKLLTENADFNYDNVLSSEGPPLDLVIVFKDQTWLERREYDGSSWWAYCRPPIQFANRLEKVNLNTSW